MSFDPFNDFEKNGYLRNHAGATDPKVVKQLEHNAFSGNILRALKSLREAPEINLEHVHEVHRILFSDVYPWAGQDRSENAADLNITKGDISFQLAPYVPQGVAHALRSGNDPAAFVSDPGKVIGELAYAHPFLDGNGRIITAVASELARRAKFHIDWAGTDKSHYLRALTLEIDEPDKQHLTNYLKPFIRQGELGAEQAALTLSTLPGLSVPAAPSSADEQPILSIVAGPNGAGKSTLTASGAFDDTKVIDPDSIARSISPRDLEAASTRAGKRALDLRRDMLRNNKSFVIETTLSGQSTLSLIDEARANGFRVELHFIGLADADLAKARVAARFAAGGHNIPNQDVIRRFERGLENLPEAISKSDQANLYDNSGKEPMRRIADLQRDEFLFMTAPHWATDAAFQSAQIDLSKAQTVSDLERSTKRALDAARAGGVSEDKLTLETQNHARQVKRLEDREGHDL